MAGHDNPLGADALRLCCVERREDRALKLEEAGLRDVRAVGFDEVKAVDRAALLALRAKADNLEIREEDSLRHGEQEARLVHRFDGEDGMSGQRVVIETDACALARRARHAKALRWAGHRIEARLAAEERI